MDSPTLQSWGGESYHNAIVLCLEPTPSAVRVRDIEASSSAGNCSIGGPSSAVGVRDIGPSSSTVQVGGCDDAPLGGCDDGPPSSPDHPESVRILFTQPLYPAMKPCPFFLEGACKFSEQECKFSHGHIAPLSRLQPYLEPDHRYTPLPPCWQATPLPTDHLKIIYFLKMVLA